MQKEKNYKINMIGQVNIVHSEWLCKCKYFKVT